jgi:hypothetical protein
MNKNTTLDLFRKAFPVDSVLRDRKGAFYVVRGHRTRFPQLRVTSLRTNASFFASPESFTVFL